MPGRNAKPRKDRIGAPRQKPPSRRKRLTKRQQESKVLGLAAVNRVRKGRSKTLAAAAQAEKTTVRTIERLLPAAVYRDASGRLRVKAGDPYSALVEIVTDTGAMIVKARGSRQRELAGHHRSVVIRVLRGKLPPSTLEEFQGKKVGGRELINDPDRLFTLAKGGELDQLDAFYVSPAVR